MGIEVGIEEDDCDEAGGGEGEFWVDIVSGYRCLFSVKVGYNVVDKGVRCESAIILRVGGKHKKFFDLG